MALEHEARREPLSSKRIASKDAGKVPVLLLRRQGNRQYFFVPGRYNPAYFNNDRETWVMVERTYPVKLFTYQNASIKFPHQLATSARFDILKAQLIAKVLELHPNWDLDLHACFPAHHPPPPTMPFERSKSSQE